MAGDIWVLAEHWRGQLSGATHEMLVLGRELASTLAVKVEAVLLGHNARDLGQTLGAADSVLYVDHPALAQPTSEAYAEVLSSLLKERRPKSLLIPLTSLSWDLGALLAAKLGVPFINSCKDIRVVDGNLQATCLLYGGKIEVTASAVGEPMILGVLPGARPAEHTEQTPSIEQVQVMLPETLKVRWTRYLEPETSDVDITDLDVLVAVGRGIGDQEPVALAEELATALGGAVCGSRPVIDQGWLPLSRQVGSSGVHVKPKLYLALGISGAPEHVEGMKDSELIIAINTDPAAPIFHVAHYGIVGDAVDMLTALKEAVRAKRG